MKSKTKSSKVNRAWLNDHVNDTYVKLAQVDDYRARAAYKLKEIDETLHLIHAGQWVVDLGSTPGAWSQYLQRTLSARKSRTGLAPKDPAGGIIALDMLPMAPIEGVQFLQGDLREEQTLQRLSEALGGHRVDLVVSDMAPNLSGIASVDDAQIETLVALAIEFSRQHLKAQGALVAKVFHGACYEPLVKQFKETFQVVKKIKPKASRDKSSETFLIGLGLKSAANPPVAIETSKIKPK